MDDQPRNSFALGYLGAVTAAAASFEIILFIAGFVDGSSSSYGLLERSGQMLIMSVVAGALFWIFALPLAAIPMSVTYATARRFRIRHVVYYLACGVVVAGIYWPLLLFEVGRIPSDAEGWQSQRLLVKSAFIFAASSAIGTMAFWAIAGRKIA